LWMGAGPPAALCGLPPVACTSGTQSGWLVPKCLSVLVSLFFSALQEGLEECGFGKGDAQSVPLMAF
jgi:hypothetical protein